MDNKGNVGLLHGVSGFRKITPVRGFDKINPEQVNSNIKRATSPLILYFSKFSWLKPCQENGLPLLGQLRQCYGSMLIMAGNYSLFPEDNNNGGPSQQTTLTSMTGKIDVVEMSFVGADTTDWQNLFSGYNRLYVVTYSSGISFICQLLNMFDYA